VEQVNISNRLFARLQRRLLPSASIKVAGWRLAAHYQPKSNVGGDYYDLLPLPEGRLLSVIADVCGHNEAAAVLMSIVRTVLHSCPLCSGSDRSPFCPIPQGHNRPPWNVLYHLNLILSESAFEDLFMTMFCSILEPATGVFRYANAGHPLPRWWQAVGQSVQSVPEVEGRPLGIDPEIHFGQGVITIEPGDVLLGFTDGVTEAVNRQGESFGSQRLDAVLRGSASKGAEEVKLSLLSHLAVFTKGRKMQDDFTVLILERKPG
jgi:phosphoserine phosphatase RsbU/P